MKLPDQRGSASHILLVIILIVALLAVAGVFKTFPKFQTPSSEKPSEEVVIDELPIWLLRDGKVAVYREIKADKDSIKGTIVVYPKIAAAEAVILMWPPRV